MQSHGTWDLSAGWVIQNISRGQPWLPATASKGVSWPPTSTPFKTLQWLCIALRIIPKLFSTTSFSPITFLCSCYHWSTHTHTFLHTRTLPFKNNPIVTSLCQKSPNSFPFKSHCALEGLCNLPPGHLWPHFLLFSPLVTLAVPLTQQLLSQGPCAFWFLCLDILLACFLIFFRALLKMLPQNSKGLIWRH